MLSLTTIAIFFSTFLLISQSSTAPTSHKATLEELTPKTTALARRGDIEDINAIIELAETVAEAILDLITDFDDAQHDIESQFTSNTVDALYAAAPTANIMVCHDCSFDLDPSASFTHYELDISGGLGFTQGYDIAVFDYGTVQNNGDGGYVNWCMEGDFSSDGSVVTFTQIADDGY